MRRTGSGGCLAISKKGYVNGYVITGTGTGVGKTVAMSYIYSMLVGRNGATGGIALKPLQTGLPTKDLRTSTPQAFANLGSDDDLGFIYNVAGRYGDVLENLVKAREMQVAFDFPCSPHLSATLSGRQQVSVQDLLLLLKPSLEYKNVLIEGAGGICVPINEEEVFGDFFSALGMPLIILSSGGLGEISNLLTTANSASDAGLKVAGFIFSDHLNLLANNCNCMGEHIANFKQPGQASRASIELEVRYNSKFNTPCLSLAMLQKQVGCINFTFSGISSGFQGNFPINPDNHTAPSFQATHHPHHRSNFSFHDLPHNSNSFNDTPAHSWLGGLCEACFSRIIFYDNARTVSNKGLFFLGVVPFFDKQGFRAGNSGWFASNSAIDTPSIPLEQLFPCDGSV